MLTCWTLFTCSLWIYKAKPVVFSSVYIYFFVDFDSHKFKLFFVMAFTSNTQWQFKEWHFITNFKKKKIITAKNSTKMTIRIKISSIQHFIITVSCSLVICLIISLLVYCPTLLIRFLYWSFRFLVFMSCLI